MGALRYGNLGTTIGMSILVTKCIPNALLL
jgi:hypothetical protein